MNTSSKIVNNTLDLIYPAIMMFGLYIIFNGHLRAGGGFQGGAVLAGAFIVRFFADSSLPLSLARLNRLEKVFYLLLVLSAVFYSFLLLGVFPPAVKTAYLMAMNLLIGAKVFCGLTIIFFRFTLFEAN